MELTVLSLIKVCGLTIIIGQGLKVIGKKEFKALVDLCGVTSAGLIIANIVISGFVWIRDSPAIQNLADIVMWIRGY